MKKLSYVYLMQVAVAGLAGLISLSAVAASTNPGYRTNNLVSDIKGIGRFDARVVNPWGVAIDTTRIFIAENGTGLITIHSLAGIPARTAIHVPAPEGDTNLAAPTGLSLNGTSGFIITNGNKHARAQVLFVTEDGTIGGWHPNVSSTNAIIMVNNFAGGAGAVYKSLAVCSTAISSNGPSLYAANFRANAIEQYNTNFQLVASFTDPTLPSGFAPFGIKIIQKKLFVTYALQLGPDNKDDSPGPGNGVIDIFNLDGTLVRSFAASGPLNSPWGLALAPTHFGTFSGNLLVGNFGDGTINAYNLITGESLGPLTDSVGNPLVIPGLWSLSFGHEPTDVRFDFEATSLLFTAGINNEADGLVGTIRAISPFLTPVR